MCFLEIEHFGYIYEYFILVYNEKVWYIIDRKSNCIH